MRHDIYIRMGGSGGGGMVMMWDLDILYCYAISLGSCRSYPHIQYVLFAAMHRLASPSWAGFHPHIYHIDGWHVAGMWLEICYLMVYVEM